MKTRTGFISNSSSTSFVIDIGKMPEDLKNKIFRLTDRSHHDCSRCTGIITDISGWAAQFDGDYDWLVDDYNKNDNIIIRESDEEMGGSFSDYGFNTKDIKPYVLYEFEFH